MCKDDFCQIKCGNSTAVLCEGEKTDESKVNCKCREANKFFDTSSKVCKDDFCEVICGKSDTVLCEGDKTDKSKIICKCKDEKKLFDNTTKVCKDNYCEEVCGKNDGVTCYGDRTRKEMINCGCKDENYFFVKWEKKCRKNYCEEVCGKNAGVYCTGNRVDKRAITCRCNDTTKIFFDDGQVCKDPCLTNPCQNGGSCGVLNGKVNCVCKFPYDGDKCQIELSTYGPTTILVASTTEEPSTPSSTATTKKESIAPTSFTATEPESTTLSRLSTLTDATENLSTDVNTDATINLTTEIYTDTTTNSTIGVNTDMTTNSTTDVNTDTITNSTTEIYTDTTTNSTTNVNTDTTTNSTTDVNTDVTTNLTTKIYTDTTTNSTTDVNTDTITNSTTEIYTDTTTNLTTDVNTDTITNSTTEIYTDTTTNLTTNVNTDTTANSTTDVNTDTITNSTTDVNTDTATNSSRETESSLQPFTTEIDPGVCKENPCQNGGTCSETEDGQKKCTCPYPYGGKICAESYWCVEGMGEELCKEPSKCDFDFKTRIGHCRCSNDEFYNYNERACQTIDRCPTTPGKCKDNKICINNDCKCKANYEMNEKEECIPSYCKALKTPCEEGAVCKENKQDPENPTCVCKEKYVFNGEKCVEMSQCDVPGALGCQQTCFNETCGCKPGYVLQNDSKKCELNDTSYQCEKDCKPGICYKEDGNETCICPQTHVFKDGTCKDLCTAGSIPNNLCPKDACEPNIDLGFRCKCEGLYTYEQNNVTCRRKLMCSEGNGKEECIKKNARCVEDSKIGFKCECAEGEDMDDDGICKKKCDLKKYQDDCLKKLAVCEMDGSKATCKCRPLVTSDSNGVCTKLAISYSGNLPFAKSYYATNRFYAPLMEMEIDYDKMRQDLRSSMRLIYGESYTSADILSCSDTSTSFNCAVEIQYKSDPKDQVRIIGDKDTCISAGSDTCFIPPGLFLETKSISLDLLSQTDPCMENLKQRNCGGNETICNREPDDDRNFNCSCAEGFTSYNMYYPVSDTRTVIHNCQDVNECLLPRACPNRTRCYNTYGSYDCLCQQGYRPHTDKSDTKQYGCVSVCDLVECGKGVCSITGNSYTCRCNTGYTGSYCDQKIAKAEDSKGAHIALITLATIVVPLMLFGAFMVHKYRILNKRVHATNYLDDNTSNLSMEPLRRGFS